MADLTKQVGEIVDARKLDQLRAGFKGGKRALHDNVLKKTLPASYQLSAKYVDAIIDLFYDDAELPADSSTKPRTRLSAADRERCVIALLASHAERFNLALHIYLGLMAGVSAEEIANILLLVGAYGGVDKFSDALDVEKTTLGVLADATNPDPLALLKSLKDAIAPDRAALVTLMKTAVPA